MEITNLIGVILSLLVGALAGIITAIGEKKKKEKAPTIEDKITTLANSLKNSISVISEIESEIENRSKIVT